jgi:hypothetical protein
MKYISKSESYTDERGYKMTHIWTERIKEPGDREREIEELRDRASFLSSHGHKGNIWERKLRAIKEED